MRKFLLGLLLSTVTVFGATNTVSDTLYDASGGLANGNLVISWSTFTGLDGNQVPAGFKLVRVNAGVFSVVLEPNDTAVPAGTFYVVNYNLVNGARNLQEFWVVPTAPSPAHLTNVRTTPSPTTSFAISLGQLSAGGATNGNCLLFNSATGQWAPSNTCTGGVTAWSNSGTDIYNSNAGNVGIGGIPGGYKLDVGVNGSGATGTLRAFDQTAVTGDTKVYVQSGAAGAAREFFCTNGGTCDVALSRNGAGILEVNSGTAGTFRDLEVRNLTLTGTLSGSAIFPGSLVIATGKTLTVNNTFTFIGVDGTQMTFPGTNATLARIDAGQTFTGVDIFTSPQFTTPQINGTSTGTGVATAATANTLVRRDANGNFVVNNALEGYTTTVTAGGTTTLTAASTEQQFFSGTMAQTVVLPVVSTLALGQNYFIDNNSTGSITVNSSGGNAVVIVGPGLISNGPVAVLTVIKITGTDATSWNVSYVGTLTASGKILIVSNTMSFTGGDGTTHAFPSSSSTLARTDAGQTFTGVDIFTSPQFATPQINGISTGTGVSVTPSANTLLLRDTNGNNFANNLIQGYRTTVTAGGTTTLTVTDTQQQFFSGTSAQTVVLPVTSTLTLGQSFLIDNNSTGSITVQSSGTNTVIVVGPGSITNGPIAILTVIKITGTDATSWNVAYVGTITASGKILTVNNTLTLAGTDGTTMTFPGTSASVARIDAAQTFVGAQTMPLVYGGSAAGSVHEIDGTSNGSPSSAFLKLQTNGQNVLIGCTGSPDAPIELSNATACTATVAPAPSGTLLHLVGADTGTPRVYMDSFAGAGAMNGRRADGTSAMPSALQSGDVIFTFGAQGYGSTGYSVANKAGIQFLASQIWTDSNQGTKLILQTTPNNSTTIATAVLIDQDASLSVNGIKSTGTKFTLTGCTAGTTVGGATAGQFASGTTGVCTVVLTMNGATGLIAANGWSCFAADITAGHLVDFTQTATSSTTCTISATTTSGDTVVWHAIGY